MKFLTRKSTRFLVIGIVKQRETQVTHNPHFAHLMSLRHFSEQKNQTFQYESEVLKKN